MALMTSRSTETVPSASVSLWNVTLRMMRLTLCVGIRTESAMKPMRPISGMTSSRAAAALVEVSTTLPRAPRVLRRSVAPAFGTASSTGGEVAAERPSGNVGLGVWVSEGAGALHDQGHAVVAPGDVPGVAGLAQDDDLLAVSADQAAFLVDDVDVTHSRLPEEEAVQRTVGTVFGDVLDHRVQRRPHRPAHVDHEAVEVVSPQVIPEHELADAAQPVDTERSLHTHGLRPSPVLLDEAHLTAWARAAGCVCRWPPRYH